MGSDPTPPAKRRRCHKKALSPRLAKLDKEFEEAGGEWRETDFEKIFKPVQRGDVQNQLTLTKGSGRVSFIAQNENNNGFVDYVSNSEYKVFEGKSMVIGRQTGIVYYQPNTFITTDGVLVLEPLNFELNKSRGLFLTSILRKQLQQFGYTNTVSAQKLRELKLRLPYKIIKNKKLIDFSYMENYIKTLEAERIETLEAYLTVTGLKDYHLTKNDEKILDTFTKLTDTESRVEYLGILSLSPVSMRELFPSIHQGRRLKKDDQIRGDLPFVMAGTTNTGIVGKIGNDVRKFPKHSITIDIFGNTFYRGYEFGAGDDTGVFWNTENTQPKSLLFLKTIIEKQLLGKYDFGHKLRASQTYDMEFQIPTQNNQPDYTFMSNFIKVIEKLVIKDLVEWTDKKIEATKEVVAQH